MATVAVFIALGGSSYAALTITGADVRNGSLTKRDLRKNTLDGSRIKESRLGKGSKGEKCGPAQRRVGCASACSMS